MKGLELDVGALVPQQVHHQLEVLGFADVARHHCEVVPVQEQLAKKLQRHTETHFKVQRAKFGFIYDFHICENILTKHMLTKVSSCRTLRAKRCLESVTQRTCDFTIIAIRAANYF